MILIFLVFAGFLFYLHRTNVEFIPVEAIPLVIFVGLVVWWVHHIIVKLDFFVENKE